MAQFLQRTGRSRDAHRDIRFSKDFHENVASLIASLTPRLRIHGVKSKVAEEEGRQANKSTAQFLKRAFSLMDRGCVIHVIRWRNGEMLEMYNVRMLGGVQSF